MTYQEALLGILLLLPAVVYAIYQRGRRAGSLTGEEKRRRRLLPKIRPYLKRRARDRAGEALRRAADLAYASKQITKAERDLFFP